MQKVSFLGKWEAYSNDKTMFPDMNLVVNRHILQNVAIDGQCLHDIFGKSVLFSGENFGEPDIHFLRGEMAEAVCLDHAGHPTSNW